MKIFSPVVVDIFLHTSVKGAPMQQVSEVKAIAGYGLEGDSYCTGLGSFNKGKPGHRQVTLINAMFFRGSDFTYAQSRRNLIVRDVELMDLIGKKFRIGTAIFLGERYCSPCGRPSKLAGIKKSFAEAFFDRGGLIAQVIEGGIIKVSDQIVLPQREW